MDDLTARKVEWGRFTGDLLRWRADMLQFMSEVNTVLQTDPAKAKLRLDDLEARFEDLKKRRSKYYAVQNHGHINPPHHQ